MAHLSPHAYAGIPEIDIFIEPKGTHFLEKDAWKEELLLQMRSEAIPVKVFRDDNEYRIWGLYFFNTDARMKEFDEEFAELTGRDIDPYAAMKVAEEPGKYGK